MAEPPRPFGAVENGRSRLGLATVTTPVDPVAGTNASVSSAESKKRPVQPRPFLRKGSGLRRYQSKKTTEEQDDAAPTATATTTTATRPADRHRGPDFSGFDHSREQSSSTSPAANQAHSRLKKIAKWTPPSLDADAGGGSRSKSGASGDAGRPKRTHDGAAWSIPTGPDEGALDDGSTAEDDKDDYQEPDARFADQHQLTDFRHLRLARPDDHSQPSRPTGAQLPRVAPAIPPGFRGGSSNNIASVDENASEASFQLSRWQWEKARVEEADELAEFQQLESIVTPNQQERKSAAAARKAAANNQALSQQQGHVEGDDALPLPLERGNLTATALPLGGAQEQPTMESDEDGPDYFAEDASPFVPSSVRSSARQKTTDAGFSVPLGSANMDAQPSSHVQNQPGDDFGDDESWHSEAEDHGLVPVHDAMSAGQHTLSATSSNMLNGRLMIRKTATTGSAPSDFSIGLQAGDRSTSPAAQASALERASHQRPPPLSTLVARSKGEILTSEDWSAVRRHVSPGGSSDTHQQRVPAATGEEGFVATKLAELDAEIRRFKQENATLTQLKQQQREGLKRLEDEMKAFERQRAEEEKQFAEFKEAETKKLRKERRLFDQHREAAANAMTKHEREELESLRRENAELKRELKEQAQRASLSAQRYKEEIKRLTERSAELEAELSRLEHMRLTEWEKQQQARAADKGLNGHAVPPRRSGAYAVIAGEPGLQASNRQGQPRSPGRVPIPASHHKPAPWDSGRGDSVDQRRKPTHSALANGLHWNVEGTHESDVEPDEEAVDDIVFKSDFDKTRQAQPARGKAVEKSDGDLSGAALSSSGGKQERILPDGRREILFRNGTKKEIGPDGRTVVHFFNGDVKETLANGTVVYFYAEAGTRHTTQPDHTEVFEFATGQVETHYAAGNQEIRFPDGTIKYIQASGEEETVFADGTVQRLLANGDRTIDYPDGQHELHTPTYSQRRYPDGTVKTVFMDGRQETRYANGRVRIKDADGVITTDDVQVVDPATSS